MPIRNQTELAAATTERWRTAGEAGDAAGCAETLADNVILRSPLTMRVPFEGRQAVRDLVRVVFRSMKNIRYQTDIGDEHTRVLTATATVAGRDIEEAQLFRLNDDAEITEITLWVRPLPGLIALMSAIGPDVARQQGRPGLARLLPVMTRPLLGASLLGDRTSASILGGRR